MKRRRSNFSNFFRKHHNLDLILSLIALVLIWRGVWSLFDIWIFKYDVEKVWGYVIPLIIGFAYLYFNDLKLSEISHTNEVEE